MLRELPPAPVSQSVWNSLTEAEKGAVVKRDFPKKYPSGHAHGLGKDLTLTFTPETFAKVYAFNSY